MDKIILAYKEVGKTPLEVINKLKKARPSLNNSKIAYAGRLDPMAEGLLLLLIGDEAKNRDYYQRLSKTYRFSVVFGLETDTYDTMGILKREFYIPTPSKLENLLKNWVKSLPGLHNQAYPPFSSATVKGKPLYWWARNGKLNEIEIPSKNIEIFEAKLLCITSIKLTQLVPKIIDNISKVEGDFRQKEIISVWKNVDNSIELKMADFEVQCSSGTYVRSLAHELGQNLGCGALVTSIIRTRIGDFTL